MFYCSNEINLIDIFFIALLFFKFFLHVALSPITWLVVPTIHQSVL